MTARATLDPSSSMGMRAAGCAFGFCLFIAALTAGDLVRSSVPSVALRLTSIVSGLALVQLFAFVSRRRWEVPAPDAIGILAHDLSVVQRRTGGDTRLAFPTGTPLRERALHEGLYALKWCGHLLFFAGLGSLMYDGMRYFGFAS